ncbi:MAG TPA: hypothetical protein VMC79_04370 [Rectinemataceae bacterium]|nr:hypothetical protein [Rectinemataceae bacterium]
MSLLEKALRGAKPAEVQGGLFAKAVAAKAVRHEAESLPGGDEPAFIRPTPEEESVFVPPEFPLSASDLAAVESEILEFKASGDYLLAVFARIAETLPLEALALFLPRGEGLALAASLGFPAAMTDYIPESVARRSGSPGSPLSEESKAAISSLLGVSPTLMLRGATMYGPADAVLGQWVFADGVLEYADQERIEAVGRLLRAPGRRASPAVSLQEPSSQPGSGLVAQRHGQRFAVAVALDLRSSYIELDMRVPGILPQAFFSVVLETAQRILGPSGAAVLTEAGQLAALLYSASELDADLVRFQFRKSLKRALPILEPIELSEGKSLLFDLTDAGSEAALSRFLAE